MDDGGKRRTRGEQIEVDLEEVTEVGGKVVLTYKPLNTP